MKNIFTIAFLSIVLFHIPLYSLSQEKPMDQEEFLEAPFGFKETIDNFKTKTTTRFKTQKYLNKNKHYPEIADTIYQFRYRKSEVFFIRTHLNKEFLIAGNIVNKRIKLINDIHVGMKKDDFKDRFAASLTFQNDSVVMIGEGTKYTFIFNKRDKLEQIKFDNYFD